MPSADQLFGGPAPAATSAGNADQLFGATHAQEEPASSPLANSRATLPQTPAKDALASPTAGAATPPSAQDVARNVADGNGGPWNLENKLRKVFGAPEVGKYKEFDKVSEADSPFPDVMPVVLGKTGTGIITGAINAVTNKSAGVSVLKDISSKLGDPIQKISDSLYALSKSAQGMKMQWLVDVKNFMPKDYAEHAEDIYHSFEDPSVTLSPRAQEIKSKAIEPIMAKNAKMKDMLSVLGVKTGPDVDNYVGRIPLGDNSIVNQIKSVLPQNAPKGINTFAPEMQSRKVFGMEGAGEQDLHLMQSKGNNTYQVWRGGKVVGSGKLGADDLANKQVSFMGEKFDLTDSTTKAIEANTPLRYHHDALLSAINGNVNLNEALRNAQFLEQFKHSPEFKQLVAPPSATAPEGFREVSIPQLKGYQFSPRVANVLDDFSGAGKNGALETLGNINRVTVGALFWNPLPHIANVLDHAITQGGLVGNAMALTYKLPSNIKNMVQAHNEVMNMGPLYRQALKEGAGLIYPSVVTKNFAESMAQQLGTEQGMGKVASAWGYANPAEMVKRVYAFSAKSLWSWNDAIMMHSYIDKMQTGHFGVGEGMGLKGAIQETEKHIPNYRIPDKVAGSRELSRLLQSPAATAFGRYDYGRLASYGNMIKDLVSKDSSIGDRAKALDQMAMLAVSSMVIYPALDHAIQKATGNDNATLRRFGAAGPVDAVHQFVTGQKNLPMLMSNLLPISPALKLPVELMSGTDTFSGQRIGSKGEPVSKYLGQQVSPVGMGQQVASGKKSATEVLAAQMGINLPSQKEVDARKKAQARDKKPIVW